MLHPHRTFSLAVLVLIFSTSVRAQWAANPSGHWEGTIQAPDRGVSIEVDLARSGKGQGALIGTFGTPEQNERGLPLSSVTVDGKSVRFLLKGTSGGTFDGVFSDDGRSITGNFITTKGSHSVPFSLTRTGEPRIEAPAKSGAIGKELEGTWNATLEASGTQKRLVLTMSNHPDGTSTGSILSEDGLEIPVTSIVQKASSLTVEVKPVAGSYSATLNAQGELVGTWTEGSLALPLTFRRAPRQ